MLLCRRFWIRESWEGAAAEERAGEGAVDAEGRLLALCAKLLAG